MALRDELIRWIENVSEMLHLHTQAGRRAFLLQAGLDDGIIRTLEPDTPVTTFCPLLIDTLLRCKTIEDGHDPVEAVILAAKERLGTNHHSRCEELIRLEGIFDHPTPVFVL